MVLPARQLGPALALARVTGQGLGVGLRTWSCDGARARDRLGTSLTNVKDLLAHAINEVPYTRPDPGFVAERLFSSPSVRH